MKIKSTNANRILLAFASTFVFAIFWLLIAETATLEFSGVGLSMLTEIGIAEADAEVFEYQTLTLALKTNVITWQH